MPTTLTIDGKGDGPQNMAADIAMLVRAESGESSARVYYWDGIWVSLGRFQNPLRDLVQPTSTQWVERPTGGKAVLHGHDVTVSMAIPLTSLGADGRSIKAIYRRLIQPIISALHRSGVGAALAEETKFSGRGAKTADCFAYSSPNDVVDPTTGQKLCGVALRVTERAALLQASIPYKVPEIDADKLIRNGGIRFVQGWEFARFPTSFTEAISTAGEPVAS